MAYNDGYENVDEDELNDELGSDGQEAKPVNDHVIVLVDARKNMFQAMDDTDGTYFEAAMKTAAELMKSKVVESARDRVGVTLFGTQKTSATENNSPNVFVIADLAFPSARRIRDVDDLAKGEVDFESRYGWIGEDDPCPLRNGLWSCQTEFMTIKHPRDFRRIFVFTNDDDPLKGNDDEKKKVQIVAKDAMEMSIEIQLFHMKRADSVFDPNKFYRSILTRDGDDYNEQEIGASSGEASDLANHVRRKQFKKRTLGRMPFHLCEGVEGMKSATQISFDVKVYNMIHTAKKPGYITLEARTNKPAQIITKLMDDKTGAQLDVHDIRTYLDFCGERAYVTKDEMESLKGFCPKGVTVLGFKGVDTLRPDFNYRSPYFVYPDEDSTTGSAKAFIALHAAMLSKKVFALARFTRASGAVPRMVALLAQAEEVDNGIQLSPPGMHAIFLPYAEDVREPKSTFEKAEIKPEVKEEGVAAAEALVIAIQLKALDCRNFENPMLQRHYAALQAVALSEEEVSWNPLKNDLTRPDNKAIDEATASIVEAFKVTYGGDQEDDVPAAGAKRSAGGGEGAAAKKVKMEDDISKIDWEDVAKSGKIETFTVAVLKEFLKSRALSNSGKKADLIARIKKCFGAA